MMIQQKHILIFIILASAALAPYAGAMEMQQSDAKGACDDESSNQEDAKARSADSVTHSCDLSVLRTMITREIARREPPAKASWLNKVRKNLKRDRAKEGLMLGLRLDAPAYSESLQMHDAASCVGIYEILQGRIHPNDVIDIVFEYMDPYVLLKTLSIAKKRMFKNPLRRSPRVEPSVMHLAASAHRDDLLYCVASKGGSVMTYNVLTDEYLNCTLSGGNGYDYSAPIQALHALHSGGAMCVLHYEGNHHNTRQPEWQRERYDKQGRFCGSDAWHEPSHERDTNAFLSLADGCFGVTEESGALYVGDFSDKKSGVQPLFPVRLSAELSTGRLAVVSQNNAIQIYEANALMLGKPFAEFLIGMQYVEEIVPDISGGFLAKGHTTEAASHTCHMINYSYDPTACNGFIVRAFDIPSLWAYSMQRLPDNNLLFFEKVNEDLRIALRSGIDGGLVHVMRKLSRSEGTKAAADGALKKQVPKVTAARSWFAISDERNPAQIAICASTRDALRAMGKHGTGQKSITQQ